MSARRVKSPLYGSREQASPEVCREHYLFLLELFVRQVSGDRLAKLNQMFCVPTSVHFGFLDFVDENDLTVTPVNLFFQPQAGIANDVEIFNAGKSVLFAVDHETVTDRSVKMILKLTVRKQMPDGIKPDILMGVGELDLSGQYAALRLEMLQYWKKGVATSKVFDGQIPLIHNQNLSGYLDIFVRMSGFGQTIVTEFDAPIDQDPSTFIFGSGELDQALSYKCRKMDSRTVDLFEDSSEELRTCPVCEPERYPCVPCGKLAAVEERDKGDDGIAGRKDMSPKNLVRATGGLTQPCGKPVVLKVSGLFDNGDIGGKKPTVTVAGESTAAKGESSDPDHDIFVLRIGKKGLVGIGEKSDIQLEMKTPKGLERRPPIRYETRDMQTEKYEEEAPKERKKIKKRKRRKIN
ncbi:hypothetical protein EAG_09833 [Camponotus floridanus]|uniref:Uncharacterized protein n=1 Tax=Camponotus floridanus TaxID=104421 RepID=E2A7X3_CAMFO|nr:uncharacterized protein LOC105249404 [Camponotus floridanus]EFN70452.1 hypothetical protein EAG_09833 [Camponotus floridanus]